MGLPIQTCCCCNPNKVAMVEAQSNFIILSLNEPLLRIFLPAKIKGVSISIIDFPVTTLEGSSGVFAPNSVYPCNFGPAPINIEALFTALDEGSTARFFKA